MATKNKKPLGEILPKESMILRTHIGSATLGKKAYEMSTSMTGRPLILSKQTGKYFSLPWADILDLAIQAGVDA